MTDAGKEAADRSSLADVLIVTRDWEWAASIEKMLTENLYGSKVALNGSQVAERMKDAWYHTVLIDLDSIEETPGDLVAIIKQNKPHIPIIGLGDHASGSLPGMICVKKPLNIGLIKFISPQTTTVAPIHTGRQRLKVIVLGFVSAIVLWVLLIWIWA